MTTNLFGVDMAQIMFGENARQVPCWMYVQAQGDGVVSLVGSSRVPETEHPLRYGSTRAHQLIVGEAIIRPHLVIATDARRGDGLPGLATGGHNLREMLSDGEIVLDPIGSFARLRNEGW